MESSQPSEGSSTSDVSGGGSDSRLQLNVKTLDSRIYSFQVDKNLMVSAFKEKIASQSGVPVGQQRLIFRGKVLKDGHVLSEYNVENGDTLHLVERQTQPSPSSNPGEASNRGADPGIGGSRNRIGHIAHSVVLGTLNVGDSGEAGVPDLSRVIGAVLNSIGAGNLAGGIPPGVQVPGSQGSETEGVRVNAGSQGHTGNQSVPLPGLQGQSPLGAAIPIPTLNMPIHDSLNTLSEFINRMEVVLQENGPQQNQSPSPAGSINQSTNQLPANSHGLPTMEALTTVIRNTQRLLTEHFVPALSRTAGRLDREAFSSDPAVRGHVHSESMQIGVAMQHLGALLLELGRTTLTLRMGQSTDDSFVNAGPAVYISPSGPNPIMVQPFPLQTSSLFSGSAGIAPNPVATGPVGMGAVPRNVNIHIHTGASLAPIISSMGGRAPNLEGEAANRADSGGTGQGRGVPGVGVLRGSDSGGTSVSSLISGFNAQIRNLVNAQNGNSTPLEGSSDQAQQARHGGTEDDSSRQNNLASSKDGESDQTLRHASVDDGMVPLGSCPPSSDKEIAGIKGSDEPSTSSKQDSDDQSGAFKNAASSGSSQDASNPESSSGVPLGLGLGGLQAKKRAKQTRTQSKNGDGANSSTQNQQARAVGQQVLQSLASLSGGQVNATTPQPSNASTARQSTEDHEDIADAMSQMLQSPSIDGLLAGVSQQTGIGSPDMLRNMLQQFTQNPAMRNTVNQIAQQVDTHSLENMFSGMDGSPSGGGFDLSRMMQQMMPIVSQALGGISNVSQPNPSRVERVDVQNNARGGTSSINPDAQNLNLRPVVQRLADQRSASDIFQSLVDGAAYLTGDDVGEDFVNELSSQGGIVQEFTEMLQRDVTRRFGGELGP